MHLHLFPSAYLLLLVPAAISILAATHVHSLSYTVTLDHELTEPVLSGRSYQPDGGSAFDFTYNAAAWAPSPSKICLAVRCQNRSGSSAVGPVTPSKIAISCGGSDSYDFPSILNSSVIFEPSSNFDVLGTEDPRIVSVPRRNTTRKNRQNKMPLAAAATADHSSAANDRELFMFYTAVSPSPNGGANARLSLATCYPAHMASDPACWVQKGQLFPDADPGIQFTKSGALLLSSDHQQRLLIFGDSSVVIGLQVAVADDSLERYSVLPNFILLAPRERSWDSALVEAGPAPLRLPTGDWLFFYNAAQRLYGAGGNQLLYNFGWAVLNGTNPLEVLQRSGVPLMMPTRSWQTQGLTPYVVFVEGAVPAQRRSSDPPQSYRVKIFYGAADTSVGAAEVLVTW